MKPIPAIVEPAQVDVDLIAEQIIVKASEAQQADASGVRYEQLGVAARATAQRLRLDIGRLLLKARSVWPERGKPAAGTKGSWSEFLQRVGMTQATAWNYMELHKTANETGTAPGTRREAGLDNRPLVADRDVKPDNEPPRDAAPVLSLVPAPDSEPEVEIDRDTWCTPPWLTEPLGRFDLDPCSNGRSRVQSATQFVLDLGIDGLVRGEDVNPSWRVFINPPYSDVGPWIAAYKHTRFCFLLKLDTSTKWFAELHAATELILIPRRRVNFIPPPGVPPDKAVAQQFPHALFYAHAEDATDAIHALCWSWRVDH